MTFEQIDQLTVESAFNVLLERVLDVSVVPVDEPRYMFDQDESKSFFERIIVHQKLVKPALSIFEAELAEYKNELNAAEQARIDEAARIESIKQRFNNINPSSLRLVIDSSIANPAMELKRIINENDEPALIAIENAVSQHESEQAAKKAAEEEMKIPKGLVALCLGCVEIVMKHNIKNALTKEQKDQQAVDYVDAFSALKDWRPGKFKAAVVAMTPDGVLVKQELKDELLAFLSENGL